MSVRAPLSTLLVFAACGVLMTSIAAADAAPMIAGRSMADAHVEVILARFREAQAGTETLQARFRQVKEDELLKEPLVQTGIFYYRKPTDFRWEYQTPDKVIVLTTEDRVRRYSPATKTVRDTALSKNRKRMYNYFGISSNIDALRKHFTIAVDDTDTAHPGADKLALTGKARRVQKRIKVLEMWIDKKLSLPSAMRIVMMDGSSTSWEFTEMKVNPKFANSIYDLKLPPETKMLADDGTAAGTPLIEDITSDEKSAPPPTGPKSALR